jgi:two-component system LytT family sensor kinase
MRKFVEVIINLIFWIIIIYLFYFYATTRLGESFDKNFGMYHIPHLVFLLFFSVIGPIINFYLFYLIFVPILLVRKRIFLFIILAIISSILVGYSFRMTWGTGTAPPIYSFSFFSIMALLWGVSGGAIKGFFLWLDSIAERMTLRKKHLESKNALMLLKAQINPHFLFNSLNNIDILIEDNPQVASKYLKKLSDILRYVLYETKEDETGLAKEIDQIKSYIELQQIRTDNPRYVSLIIKGEIKEQRIAPMIFIPFVENAFKHCKNKTIDNAIDIEFDIRDNKVKMVCKNYFESDQLEVINNEGLGNETIRQRLNLLYPKNHELIIDKIEHWFKVTISIYLKDGN